MDEGSRILRCSYEEETRKERLRETLQAWRRHAGLTRQEIAKIMGVNPSTVSRMESNVDKASSQYVSALCQSMWHRESNYCVVINCINSDLTQAQLINVTNRYRENVDKRTGTN